MRKFATADCETDPFLFSRVPKPFIWGFFDGETFQHFFDTRDFVEAISKFEGIIYFHNDGKFDIHFLTDFIEPQTDVIIINSRLASLKIGKAELRDSYLLLPVPLKNYKKDDIDYAKMEASVRWHNIEEIKEYLKGDCEYLYEILSVQFDQFGQKLTLASSAFSYWQKHFNQFRLTPRSSVHYFNHFKKFYFGGRVECFQKGVINDEFTVSDINSAYPYAMLHNHPFGTEYKICREIPQDTETCFITIRGVSKGALPFRDKSGLYFPRDNIEREYHATGWEIKKALELKALKINRLVYCAKFSHSINFADYVNYFFNVKEKARTDDNKANYLLAKLYLNSLYGKFGQSSEDHREYIIDAMKNVSIHQNENGYAFDGNIGEYALLSKTIPPEKQKFYNVATAASVTGFVRAYLFEHILNSDGVLYCDTDSLVCKKFRGKLGNELGQWKHEGDFDFAAIAGKKLYALREKGKKGKYKIAAKGAHLTPQQIIKVASGETVTYKSDAPSFGFGREPFFVERKIKLT